MRLLFLWDFQSKTAMSEIARLASIPKVSLKMFSLLLNDGLQYMLQGSDIPMLMQPLNVWFNDLYHRRNEQPLAVLRNSHVVAAREIANLIAGVHPHILAHASLRGSDIVMSTFDTAVLYTFYICRTVLGATPEALLEDDVFDYVYANLNAGKFLAACTKRDRAQLTRVLSVEKDGGKFLGVKKGMRLTDHQWEWLFVLASLMEQKNENNEKVRLILDSAAVVRKAYETAVSQPRSQSHDRQRTVSRLSSSSPGRRLTFD